MNPNGFVEIINMCRRVHERGTTVSVHSLPSNTCQTSTLNTEASVHMVEIRSKQLLNQYIQGGSVISDSRHFESGECDTPVQPSLIVPINMTFTAEKRQRTS